MTSLLVPISLLNRETGKLSCNRSLTERSLNSNPYRFPYRPSFLLLFCLTPPTFSMDTLLSPSQECHPFLSTPLSHDLVVRTSSSGAPKHTDVNSIQIKPEAKRKTVFDHVPDRESSQGSSSLSALVCSGLGAFVQKGNGSPFSLLIFSSDSFFSLSSMVPTPCLHLE